MEEPVQGRLEQSGISSLAMMGKRSLQKAESTPNVKLEAARLERRWSVEVASNKVGVSVNTFNRWERGLQIPQLETLDLLCKAFKMRPEELGFGHVISVKRRQRASPKQAEDAERAAEHPLHPTTVVTRPIDGSTHVFQQFQPTQTYCTCIGSVKECGGEATLEHASNNMQELSRRQAMTFLISTPAAIFQLAPGKQSSLLHPEEVLAVSRVNISLCWKLYFEGGFAELEQVLPGYLAQVSALVQNTSSYSRLAAELASQAHQLAYLLALQGQNFGIALQHTQEALRYGQQAEDINLQVTAMVRQAYVYFCLKRSSQRLHTYEQALRRSADCSPLIQGYLYAGLAEAYASRGEQAGALDLLHRAQHTFPERPEDDPHFSYTHFQRLTLHNFAGLVHLHLAQARQAWDSFARVDQAVTQGIVPHRVELMVYQAQTALELGELEQSCELLRVAAVAATKLSSHLRYQEACRVYDQLQERWPHERRVQELQELFL